MADYWVDDGGNNTTGASWTTAYTSISALVAAVGAALTTSGNRVFIGDDHIDSVTGANRTFTGPSSGAPVILISADRTDNAAVPAYKVGTGKSLRSDDGAFSLTLDGAFAGYGLLIVSGAGIALQNDNNESAEWVSCTFKPAANGSITYGATGGSVTRVTKCTIDLGSDASSNRSANVFSTGADSAALHLIDATFSTAIWRTGSVIGGGCGFASGCDFSGFTNATACELYGNASATGAFEFVDCKTASTWALTSGSPANYIANTVTAVNCGTADAPQYLGHIGFMGTTYSSTVTRTGGATIEGTAVGWLVTTIAATTEHHRFYTPWIYGVCSSTGSKTFTLYIGNNTADLTDAEAWLEVESMGDAGGSAQSELTTDRHVITTTAAAQTDDTGSTWSSAQTYMQSLAVTATVDQAGLFRARVAVAKASVTDLRIDPKVTVS